MGAVILAFRNGYSTRSENVWQGKPVQIHASARRVTEVFYDSLAHLQVQEATDTTATLAGLAPGCLSPKPDRGRILVKVAVGRDSSREQNWPAGRLRKRSTWASQGCGTDADLHRLNGASPLNQLFRRPAASRIGDAARPPAGMTLIVLTRLAWVQPAASLVCPSQGRHACDRCDNKRRSP